MEENLMQKFSGIYIQLFGNPTVFLNGHPTKVSRKRVRALLFYLATENKAVSRRNLAYMLWPDKEYSVAAQNLSIYLTYLKKELVEDSIVSSVDRIELAASITSDITVFNKLSQSKNPDELLKASSLIHEQFLDGFILQNSDTFEQWTLQMSEHWQQRFVSISTSAAKALKKCGRYEEAITCLDNAAKIDPMHEEVCRLRMEVFMSIGRRSEVTNVYCELVSLLNNDLGVSPSPETMLCYQQMISSEVSTQVDEKKARPSLLGGKEMIFVGRHRLLNYLLNSDLNRFVLVSGKSGIGKTRLVNTCIQRSKCYSIALTFRHKESESPYFGIIKFLRSTIFDKSNLEEVRWVAEKINSDDWSTLCFLVPEFMNFLPCISRPTAVSVSEIKVAFESFLHYLVNGRKTIFFIDNLHYADTSSLEIIQYIRCQASLDCITIFSTYRPSLSNNSIIAFLNVLQRDSLLQIINLEKLDDTSMLELLLYYYPDIDSESASNLVSLADGNPFWMERILLGLDSGYSVFSGQNSLVQLFEQSFLSLSQQAENVIYILAVVGESIDLRLFKEICTMHTEHGEDDSEKIYKELFLANLLSKESSMNIRFSHSRIYEYTLDRMNRSFVDTKNLQTLIARAMINVYGNNIVGQQLVSITDHLVAGTHPKSCAEYATRAGEYLMSIENPVAAVKYYKLAYSYLDVPTKFNALLSYYSAMLQLGCNYEADAYIHEALHIAEKDEYAEYMLIFRALSKLSQHGEYLEIFMGCAPCYSIELDSDIEKSLLEAKPIAGNKNNYFLLNHIYYYLYIYYWIKGDFNNAQVNMQQIIDLNITKIYTNKISTNMLAYSALRDIINLFTYSSSYKLVEMIRLEELFYKSAPLKCFSYITLGSKSLLLNYHGNNEEGIRLMNEAISQLRRSGNSIALANALAVQAMIVGKTNREKSYSMNYEARQLAKANNARYVLVKALVGLVKTCSDINDAKKYYNELAKIAEQIGNDSLDSKLKASERLLESKV